MTLRLSRRIPGLVAAAFGFYIFATTSEVAWLYGLAALVLALLPIGLVAPLIAVRRLRITAHHLTRTGFIPPLGQDRGKVFVGDSVVLRLECTGNLEACRFVALRGEDGRSIDCSDGDGDGDGAIILAAASRGLTQVRAVQVSSSWPLGVLEVRRWRPLRADFVVHPTYVLPPTETRAGATELVGEASLRGTGEEFIGLREYQPGDSQRRVHWPTSARAGKLMVIETAVESRSPARFRVDLPPGTPPEPAELAATIAASLAAGSVATGRPFRIVLPGMRQASVRWRDALANLAMMQPAPALAVADDSVVIAADPGGVTVGSGSGTARLSIGASLDDVAAALAQSRGPQP